MVNNQVIGVLGFWQDLTELSRFLDSLSESLTQATNKINQIHHRLDFGSRQIEDKAMFTDRQAEDKAMFTDRQAEDKLNQ